MTPKAREPAAPTMRERLVWATDQLFERLGFQMVHGPEASDRDAFLGRIRITPARRLAFFVLVDSILLTAAVVAAFLIRLETFPPRTMWADVVFTAAVLSTGTVGCFLIYGVYRVSWSFVGFRDIALVGLAVLVGTIALGAMVLLWAGRSPLVGFPRSIVLIQAPLAFLALASFRLWRRARRLLRRDAGQGAPTLLVGAGEAGEQVLKSLLEGEARRTHRVVGFVDDDPLSHGTSIHGVEVLGPLGQLDRLLPVHAIRAVIICIASASSGLVRDVVGRCREAGVRDVRIIPPFSELVQGIATFQATRQVSLEDLLGRDPVNIRHDDVASLLSGKRVLVTGGAGTIGTELCRQIARFRPGRLVVLDVDETRLHDTALELREADPTLEVVEALVDLRRQGESEALFAAHKPQVVFHAAAYKHVPVMEEWPLAALEVNVLGTSRAARLAEEHGCERFILVSTDKAVQPSSVMGASKRLAELVLFGEPGDMVRSAVRFGNVIGSRGSVIPIFERQLKHGGPLTVTHPEVERYFMMTSEAVALVLQAAALGQGRDVFILDMGKPVRILDVAHEFCRLHGLEPGRDVPIVFTGLRQGEKLSESLSYPDEVLASTHHPRVLRTHVRTDAGESGEELLADVAAVVERADPGAARRFLVRRFPLLSASAPMEHRAEGAPALAP